jgi:hypothetical protein
MIVPKCIYYITITSALPHIAREALQPKGAGKSSAYPKVPSQPSTHHITTSFSSKTNTHHNGFTDTSRALRQEARPILQHRRRTRTVRRPLILHPHCGSPQQHHREPLPNHPMYPLTPPPEPPATPAPSKSSAPTTRSPRRHDPATHTAAHGKTYGSTFRAHGTGWAWERSRATQRGGC